MYSENERKMQYQLPRIAFHSHIQGTYTDMQSPPNCTVSSEPGEVLGLLELRTAIALPV
jgi:hypothetical protein